MKRKKIALMIAMTMALGVSGAVYAEEGTEAATSSEADDFGIDLESMDLDKLLSLKDKINEVIADKGGDNVIGIGLYTVGTDIKAGKYTVKCYNSDQVTFYIYDDENAYNEYSGDMLLLYPDDECGMLNLSNGQIISVYTGSAIIEESKPSWAPTE